MSNVAEEVFALKALIRDVATEVEAVEKRLRRLHSLERVKRVCNLVSLEALKQ